MLKIKLTMFGAEATTAKTPAVTTGEPLILANISAVALAHASSLKLVAL